MQAAALNADAPAFHIALKNALIHSMALLLAYAVPIPNTWRSAMAVVLAAYPAVTVGVLSHLHPETLRLIDQEGACQLAGLNLTMTVASAGLSLNAIHILSTLREEIFEARRLNQYL